MEIRKKIDTYLMIGELFRNVGVEMRPASPPTHVLDWLCRKYGDILPEDLARDAVYYRVRRDEDENETGFFGLLLHPEIAFDLAGTGLSCADLGIAGAQMPADSPVCPVVGEIQFASVWELIETHRLRRALVLRS